MIIKFTVTNFRSIHGPETMTFQIGESINQKTKSENLIFNDDKSHGKPLIRSGVLFGANASGKSNFLRAIKTLETMVLKSSEYKLDSIIPTYEPFKLDGTSKSLPCTFEIDFVAKDGIRYNYLVEFDQTRILREELNFFERNRKLNRHTLIFSRNQDIRIQFGESYQGEREFNILENQLLLSRAGLEKLPSLTEVYRFFSSYLFIEISHSFEDALLKKVEEILTGELLPRYKHSLISLIKAADTGIIDLFTESLNVDRANFYLDNDPLDERNIKIILNKNRKRIKTIHPVFTNGVETGVEFFDLLREESTGTIKLLGIAAAIIDALDDGFTVIIDELDKHLHPLLSRMIINLFHDLESNPHNAQLIFSTHDISLFDRDLFRRDQIFLVDKSLEGKSTIRRLSDIKGISKVVPIEKWYMAGLFKAVPSTNPYLITLPE
ncbi:MAG: ATP-binding protein [Saprospiraceae bacterium]|nr:ATP-binding protein [Saprospiraceae bacterium]